MGALPDMTEITRGTRQGCPLSPLLFTVYSEPLAAKIRQTRLEGHERRCKQEKLTLFNDYILNVTIPERFGTNI